MDEIPPLDRLVTLQVAKEICPIRTVPQFAHVVIHWPALPSKPVPSELPSPVPIMPMLPPPMPSSPPSTLISSTPTPPTPPTLLQQTTTTTTTTPSPLPSPPPSPQQQPQPQPQSQTITSLPEPTPSVENPLPEGNPFMNPTQYPDEEIVASIMGLAPTALSQGPSVSTQGK